MGVGELAAAGRPADSAVEVETSVRELFGTGHIDGCVLACSMGDICRRKLNTDPSVATEI